MFLVACFRDRRPSNAIAALLTEADRRNRDRDSLQEYAILQTGSFDVMYGRLASYRSRNPQAQSHQSSVNGKSLSLEYVPSPWITHIFSAGTVASIQEKRLRGFLKGPQDSAHASQHRCAFPCSLQDTILYSFLDGHLNAGGSHRRADMAAVACPPSIPSWVVSGPYSRTNADVIPDRCSLQSYPHPSVLTESLLNMVTLESWPAVIIGRFCKTSARTLAVS